MPGAQSRDIIKFAELLCGRLIFLMDQSLLSPREFSSGIVEGSVAVPSAQRAPAGFTTYRVVFKVMRNT